MAELSSSHVKQSTIMILLVHEISDRSIYVSRFEWYLHAPHMYAWLWHLFRFNA